MSLLSPKIDFMPNVPEAHTFFHYDKPESYEKPFISAWKKDLKILRTSLPSGIHVKFFDDRMDLISAMITGPQDTPYEGCLFLFDVALPTSYPNTPPRVRFIKFHEHSSQIHPNIFCDGSICLSLLNSAAKRAKKYSLFWMPYKSTLLQVFVSLQGLVLAKDPVNNISARAARTLEESKSFNLTYLQNSLVSMKNQITNPPEVFKDEVLRHYKDNGMEICNKLRPYTKRGYGIMNIVKRIKVEKPEPPFPLMTPIPEILVTNLYEALRKLNNE